MMLEQDFRHTDTTVFNPVISPKSEGGQIQINAVYNMIIKKTDTEDLLEQKYFTGSMSLLTKTTALGHVAALRH